jgi:hypothetical protein
VVQHHTVLTHVVIGRVLLRFVQLHPRTILLRRLVIPKFSH